MARILFGVSGGVAAYKSLEVVSALRKRGEELKIVITEEATKFVAPLTFSVVGNCPVYVDPFQSIEGSVIHTTISQWAEIMVIAPLTANTAAKIACGIANNLLTMSVLAFNGLKIASPSMNVRMYENPITLENIEKLKKNGWHIVEPESGHLADGEYGKGRYPKAEFLIFEIDRMLTPHDYKGKKVLVTAGPTREAIDPVRYVTNRSSGKMGYELARAAYLRGAEVKLISGPVNIKAPYGVEVLNVESAKDMSEAVLKNAKWADIVIMAAAVADYRPFHISTSKIKKTSDELNIKLVKTNDILKDLSKIRLPSQFIVGFAAETDDLLRNAQKKLKEKKLDMIIANDVSRKDIGFDSNYNEVKILRKDGKIIPLQRNEKRLIAHNILDIIKSQSFKEF